MDNDDNSIETTDMKKDFLNRLTTVDSVSDEGKEILKEAQTLVSRFNETEVLNTNKNATNRAECFFDVREEDVLYDAWIVLRDAGWSLDDLNLLSTLIVSETIYETSNMEVMYRICLCGEDEEKVLALSEEELLQE